MRYGVIIDMTTVALRPGTDDEALAAINDVSRRAYPWHPHTAGPFETLDDALAAWSIRTEAGQPWAWDGKNWHDAYEEFFHAIAPFVVNRAQIQVTPEAGTGDLPWRYLFRDGLVLREDAELVWVAPAPEGDC